MYIGRLVAALHHTGSQRTYGTHYKTGMYMYLCIYIQIILIKHKFIWKHICMNIEAG
jgi:hypothetical protein